MSESGYRSDRSWSKRPLPCVSLGPVLAMLRRALEQHGQFIFAAEGNSMSPAIDAGDQVVVSTPTSPIQVGDVVVVQGPNGLYAHRVICVDAYRIVTMGDNNALVDEPITETDILGVTKAKLVDGKEVPLANPGVPSLVSVRSPGRVVVTITKYTPTDLYQLEALATALAFQLRHSPTVAGVAGLLDDQEYTIGICPHAPASEAGVIAAVMTLPEKTKINFLLGAEYGYAGNRLGLLPHGAVDMLARLGIASFNLPPLCATAGYLVGLVQGCWHVRNQTLRSHKADGQG